MTRVSLLLATLNHHAGVAATVAGRHPRIKTNGRTNSALATHG